MVRLGVVLTVPRSGAIGAPFDASPTQGDRPGYVGTPKARHLRPGARPARRGTESLAKGRNLGPLHSWRPSRRGTTNASYGLIMGEPKSVGCYGYVTREFEDVCKLLRQEPLDLLQRATTSAAARARSLTTSLRVELAGIEIGVNVRVRIRRVRDREMLDGGLPALRVELTWEAVHNAALFPSMLAELLVRPLSGRETQIEIQGAYWTPMGPLGTAFDAAIGHRIAEATVHRFLSDLVEQLHRELPPCLHGKARQEQAV